MTITREELKAHCEKEIEMCEFWARYKGENLNNSKIYQEHVLVLELLEQPCQDAINRILNRMWNCRGKHTTSIDKVKMEQIIRDELSSVNLQKPCRDIEEIEEVMNSDADAETKCKMISNILTAKPHYFEEPQKSEDKQ